MEVVAMISTVTITGVFLGVMAVAVPLVQLAVDTGFRICGL